MPAIEPLCRLFGVDSHQLSKEESIILEAEIFFCLCEELIEVFRKHYRNYFSMMKFNKKMEDGMLETNFIRLIIEDILATEEYTLPGIAAYTETPEEVIQDILIGHNSNPSGIFLRKIIGLHRSVRFDLYSFIVGKIFTSHLRTV